VLRRSRRRNVEEYAHAAGRSSAVPPIDADGAGGTSFAPVASLGAAAGADLESLISQGNVEVA
jgi:hypothetical protein